MLDNTFILNYAMYLIKFTNVTRIVCIQFTLF